MIGKKREARFVTDTLLSLLSSTHEYEDTWSRWPRVEEYTFEYRKMWHRATTLNTSKRGFSTLNINFPLPEHTP